MDVASYIENANNVANSVISNFTVSDFVVNTIVIGITIYLFIKVIKKNFGEFF